MSALIRAWLLAVCCLLIPSFALGQEGDAPDPDTVEARAHFDRGRGLAEQRRFSEAAEAFRQSLALVDRPTTAYNLALCYYALERYVEAIEALDRYREQADIATEGEAYVEAQRMLAHAQRAVAEVHVDVIPADASVMLDGHALEGSGARTARVNPGSHVIRVEADGHAPQLIEVEAEPGVTLRRAVQLVSTRNPARLEVSLLEEVAGTQILVDGEEVGTTSARLEVAPGEHTVSVMAPDRETVVRPVVLEHNQHLRLDLDLGDSTLGGGTIFLEEPVFWGVVGATVAAVGAGILIGWAADEANGPSGGSTGVVLDAGMMPQGAMITW
ncbi:MAG: PEGA domain-containing protein [Sandaracinaceae bacterium]